MFLHHPTTSSDGIQITHHRISAANLKGDAEDFDTLTVWIDSWPSEELRLAGNPIVARWHIAVPTLGMDFNSGLRAAILTAVQGSEYFRGSTLLADPSTGQPEALERKLTMSKKIRRRLIEDQITALEESQRGSIRKVVLKMAARQVFTAPLAKLQEVEDAIAPLQAKVAAITACTTQAELDAIQ